ncbi:MAG: glutamine--tRNA ligase/YqeY domain fusion protein [Deltaproteobacteria bacterium]|nr:glutamine--tRNA ligase/YqeY domain fusion protein [Deltaproteobacteria bacterium]
MNTETNQPTHITNFIRNIIDADIQLNKNEGRVITRFPPEPNGFLHIGHAKSICINFGLARDYGGRCHLRFDDTNPTKEEDEYVSSIKQDVKWLGFDWGEHLYFASDYFTQMYEHAVTLVKKGLAYVDDSTPDAIRSSRGTLTESGKESPCRNRTIEDNLDLFSRMKNGEFPDGAMVLRAKIDMSSPNINLRDPVMYRILHASHHRTGDRWCIYPMYDWAHGIEDSIEGITHSICTLEFEDHRPLYDWFLKQLGVYHPQQIEFARLNLNYTVMSKRKLLELVNEKHVSGWDDPRLPTISGFRRRGYTPESIRLFCDRLGVGKKDAIIDMSILEDCVREDLDVKAKRVMCVLDPIKVVITNWPDDKLEELGASIHPKTPEMGRRSFMMTREVYIDRDDFMLDPPKNFFRLGPKRQVRLKYAYVITCDEVIKDTSGRVIELRCTYDPETGHGKTPEGKKKVKGIIHWVSAPHAQKVEVRLYDRLFDRPNPGGDQDGGDYKEHINPHSLKVIGTAYLEQGTDINLQAHYQFERVGYFFPDPKDSTKDCLVFNRVVTLRDSWGGEGKQGA